MRSQIFNTFWYGSKLPLMQRTCLSSFVQHGHQLRVFGYQELELPEDVILEDARQIVNVDELFEFEGSFAAFSNIFRYKLLLETGEWWVDTDVCCLSDDIPECAYAWAREDKDRINNALLKFPAGDPTIEDILGQSLKIGKDLKVKGELGPHLLTENLADREFEGHFGSTRDFYPIHWLETHMFWMPGGCDAVMSRCENSPFVHLWGSCFEDFGIDARRPAPTGSFMHHIYQQSGLGQEMPPLDESEQQSTLATIEAHLAKRWVKNLARRLFGHEIPFEQ